MFNTLWYTGAFACFWYLAKVPRGQGLAAAARSFAVVFGGVYAGSQVRLGRRQDAPRACR